MKNTTGRFYPTERVARSNRWDFPHLLLGSQVSSLHSKKKTGKKMSKMSERKENSLPEQSMWERRVREVRGWRGGRNKSWGAALTVLAWTSPAIWQQANHLLSVSLTTILLNTNLGDRLRKLEGRMALNFCTKMDGSSCFSSHRVFSEFELILEILLSQTFWFLSQVFSMLEVWGTLGVDR